MSNNYSKAAAGTFALNKKNPIHGWYLYLEGYSACLIDSIINEIGIENIQSIYDPFCGTGTTSLVASSYGIKSYYSETNPFMQQVIEAKVNCVKRLRDSGKKGVHLKAFLKSISNYNFKLMVERPHWDGFEKYFDDEVLFQLQELLSEVEKIKDEDSRQIALIVLASVLVKSSKMIRQGDLRFAKDSEKSSEDKDIYLNFVNKLKASIKDIESDDCLTKAETICLSEDARNINEESIIDCIITSPPYLNGTNYIRNTKLELKLTGHIKTEKDLPSFHSKGIIAGINNVSKRNVPGEANKYVKPYLDELTPVAYDKRIPLMVQGYFHDMEKVIEKLSHALRENGKFIMDIGDSQFAGVHIPTHEILTKICEDYGFKLYNEEILRERRSKNGMVLTQRLLMFTLHKKYSLEECYKNEAINFINKMPYRQPPYSGRNWGHPWHSLCSYHGKLKPSIAHFMVQQFTKTGDVVLDPLCGVGTIPFEACLQGRIGIGNDLSEMAYVVTKAKLEKPTLEECNTVLDSLQKYLSSNKNSTAVSDDIEKYENFGFNGKLSEYFHPDTFREIICARKYFIDMMSKITSAEAMVYSCFLHILHGNRPYALSRNSHPLTPYAPKGSYVYKNVIEHIKDKLILAYKKGDFNNYINGEAILENYEQLDLKNKKADVILCSPPFAGSIRFYMQNWMRLWLCGWEETDFKNAESVFLDQKQKKDFDVYLSFFKKCSELLKPNGKVVLHLGKTDKIDMADELQKRAVPYFTEIYRGSENVEQIEKHGIKDKGATVEHQFLFLLKK